MVKNTKEQGTRNKIYLLIFLTVLLGILVGKFFFYTKENITPVQSAYLSLQKDMKSLQPLFENNDSGWQYQEGCKGKGGDFQVNEPSDCFSMLSNNKVVLGEDPVSHVEKYKSIIDRSNKFTKINNITEGSTYTEFTTKYAPFPAIKCSFLHIKTGTDNSNKPTLTFSCAGYTDGFYYIRTDT